MYPLVILAGGKATRLGKIAQNIPKCLIPVAGKPFLNWQLEYIKNQNIREVYICSGWLSDKIENHIDSLSYLDLNINIIPDGSQLLGTGGAIQNILGRLSENFFVLYGDTYLPIDFKKVEDYHKNNNMRDLLTIYKNNGKLDQSNIIYKDNAIIKYRKKNNDRNMKFIDYGLSIMSKKSFNSYGKKNNFDLSDMYEYLVSKKLLNSYLVNERFYEIGTPISLMETEKYMREL